MQATNFTFNKPLFDAKIEAAIASDAAAILPNLAEFTPALPELEPVTSHPLIEKLKITQHVWNSLFQPLLPKPFQSATIPTAQISWEFAANGDLVITLKDILDESLIDLKERLEQNHRLKDVQVNEQQLTLIMPNHYLLHLFFEKPQLLQEIYNLHPEIKGMHQSLLKGTPIDKLITNDLKTVQLFEKKQHSWRLHHPKKFWRELYYSLSPKQRQFAFIRFFESLWQLFFF